MNKFALKCSLIKSTEYAQLSDLHMIASLKVFLSISVFVNVQQLLTTLFSKIYLWTLKNDCAVFLVIFYFSDFII